MNNTDRMKKIRNKIALFLAAVMVAGSLTGCSESDVKDFFSTVGKGAKKVEEVGEETLNNALEKAGDSSSGSSGGSGLQFDLGNGGDWFSGTETEQNASGTYPTDDMTKDREAIGLTDDAITTIRSQQEGFYYYGQLTDEEQVLYAEIYQILSKRASDIYVSTTNIDEMEAVQQCVLCDHPEIFFVTGYAANRYMDANSTIKAITYGGQYTLTSSEIEAKRAQLETVIQKIIAGAPASTDEYEVVKYFYDYIVLHTEYDLNAEDNQNICSVFLNGSSVCQGYAKAMQYLLQRKGMTAELVTGNVQSSSGSGSHAWDLVKVNGNWYYVDPTWGDASFSGEMPSDTEVVNYAYLCVTTNDLTATHSLDSLVPYPDCTATADNYFVRENAYFSTVDTDMLSALFANGYANGDTVVSLKCTDASVYQQMQDYLFTDSNVFDYLSGDMQKVVYLSQDTTNTIMIWL